VSGKNGDKARFNRKQKKKVLRKKRIREHLKARENKKNTVIPQASSQT
jgi:hypothetical protein